MTTHTEEKKAVIKAIGELGRRVTTADVATKTGLPVLVVAQNLNEVAAETEGHLEVATTGDIAYSFRPGFANAYLTRGIQRFFEVAGEKIFKFCFYLLKISFGIMLVVSLLIVMVTIFALMMSQRRGDRDDDGFHFNFFDYLILREVFYWTATSAMTRPVVYDYNTPTVRQKKNNNFLLNCFSFLFGDGDPNEGLEEKRWQLIAHVIKCNGNVVTAEQLAPYLGSDPKNEDAVLPVLVRFNGKPEVTESGNIVYVFPDLTATAIQTPSGSPPPFLREFTRKFTEASQSALTPVYIIAGLNFAGSWFLWTVFYNAGPGGYVPMLFNVLVAYGTLFLVIPLVRALVLQHLNKHIESRNRVRAGYAELLRSPTEQLSKKLLESRRFSIQEQRISSNDIVYTTEKDSLDQEDDLSRKFTTLEKGETFDASP